VKRDPVIKWLCDETNLPDKMKTEGRPARLAYALLGALLANDPNQAPKRAEGVKSRVDAYLADRRKLRRQRKAPR
jgi:hypothetical protein